MKEIIITSEVDKNYFIINSGGFSLAYIYDLLIKIDDYLANQIKELADSKEIQNKLLFVSKNSELGIALEKLIEDKKLTDTSELIEPRHLTNALMSQINTSDDSIKETIINMIKDNAIGSVDELESIYPKETLKKINRVARLTWYSNNSSRRKYLKEIYLTGYELKGIIYINNDWHNIEIHKNKITPIESPKKRTLQK